jgi:hypothetical protein
MSLSSWFALSPGWGSFLTNTCQSLTLVKTQDQPWICGAFFLAWTLQVSSHSSLKSTDSAILFLGSYLR